MRSPRPWRPRWGRRAAPPACAGSRRTSDRSWRVRPTRAAVFAARSETERSRRGVRRSSTGAVYQRPPPAAPAPPFRRGESPCGACSKPISGEAVATADGLQQALDAQRSDSRKRRDDARAADPHLAELDGDQRERQRRVVGLAQAAPRVHARLLRVLESVGRLRLRATHREPCVDGPGAPRSIENEGA